MQTAVLALMTKVSQTRKLRLMDFNHFITDPLYLMGTEFEPGSVNFRAHTISKSFTASLF